jgi:hypothetical protein
LLRETDHSRPYEHVPVDHWSHLSHPP